MPRFAERLFPLVAVILLVLFYFYRGYWAPHPIGHQAIDFYPGQYARIVFNSGEPISGAMQAVHAASDPAALTAAIAVVQKMVDAGDAEAAFRLGRYYHLESAEPDYKLALKYYQIAADENHAWAMNNLGLLYQYGLGVGRDDEKAYNYYEQASRYVNPWSYNNLSQMTGNINWLAQGAAKDCNLRMIFIDRMAIMGGDGKAAPRSTARLVYLAIPVKQTLDGATGQMIIHGLTPPTMSNTTIAVGHSI